MESIGLASVHGILRDFSVYLRSLQGYMTEKVFHHDKWHSRFNHMSGSGMSHGMRCVVRSEHATVIHFCLVNVLRINFFNTGYCHLFMSLARKHMTFRIIRYFTMIYIFLQHI